MRCFFWQTALGKQRLANSAWQTVLGKQRLANSAWQTGESIVGEIEWQIFLPNDVSRKLFACRKKFGEIDP